VRLFVAGDAVVWSSGRHPVECVALPESVVEGSRPLNLEESCDSTRSVRS
jgi:hypothetical protein